MNLLLALCLFFLASVRSELRPCQLRKYSNGYVCVCNETYCDTTDVQRPTIFGDYIVITSTQTGKRFDVGKGRFKRKQYPSVNRIRRNAMNNTEREIYTATLTIDRDEQFQEIVGFGGMYLPFVSIINTSLYYICVTLKRTINCRCIHWECFILI